ncbi:MAG: RDD family protein [Pseudomonadota bacterium]
MNEVKSLAAGSLSTVGFWPRLAAGLVDSLFTMAVFLPPMYVIFGPRVLGLDHQEPDLVYSVLSLVIPAVIIVVFWVHSAATPGKMIIRSVIVDADTGGMPSMRQWLLRYLGYYVACVPLGVGLLWVHWDKRHQGWHDKLANTLVVRK